MSDSEESSISLEEFCRRIKQRKPNLPKLAWSPIPKLNPDSGAKTTESDPSPFLPLSTRFGGSNFWHSEDRSEWPKCDDGHVKYFFCQINISTLPQVRLSFP